MHVYNVYHDTEKELEYPDVKKQQKHSQEKQQPHAPAHARALGHEQHAVHSSAQADACAVERFVHGLGLLFCQFVCLKYPGGWCSGGWWVTHETRR